MSKFVEGQILHSDRSIKFIVYSSIVYEVCELHLNNLRNEGSGFYLICVLTIFMSLIELTVLEFVNCTSAVLVYMIISYKF